MDVFRASRGIVPACDVSDLSELTELVRATSRHRFIVGYKIGMILAVTYGLPRVVAAIRENTDLPIIYDHQKFGSDIPELSSGSVVDLFAQVGLAGVIVFPHAGIRTLTAAVTRLREAGLLPIVGGEMTHPGYLASEGGYLEDDAPRRIYADAATMGVDHFVVPGTRLDSISRYRMMLVESVASPRFLFPGVGKGQGGDIVECFRRVAPCAAYAIVGRGIYGESDQSGAAQRMWDSVEGADIPPT